MAVGGYGNIASNVVITSQNTTAVIYNVVVGTANTEFSQALPANCKEFLIRARGTAKIKLAYTSGQSGTLFLTLEKGVSYNDKNFYSSQTLYFQLDILDTVEIVTYS